MRSEKQGGTLVTGALFALLAGLGMAGAHLAVAADPPVLGWLPAGVDIQVLADSLVEPAVEGPARLQLERMRFDPTADSGPTVAVGPTMVYIESGDVLVMDVATSLEGAYSQGQAVSLAAGVSYAIRNDGQSPAVILRAAAGAAEVTAPATPATAVQPKVDVLVDLPVAEIPTEALRLILARLTVARTPDAQDVTFAGPVALSISSGDLELTGPSGITGHVNQGRGVALPGGTYQVANTDTQPTELLLVGLVPQVIKSPPPVVTGSTSAPGGVIYRADAGGGFDAWLPAPGWKTVNGALVNDGRESRSTEAEPTPEPGGGYPPAAWIAAPVPELQQIDYAVEARIRAIRPDENGASYGIVGRFQDDGAYWVGVTFNSVSSDAGRYYCFDDVDVDGQDVMGYIYGGLDNGDREGNWCPPPDDHGYPLLALASDPFKKWDAWHVYRVEVTGTTIRFMLDGESILEADDTRFTTPGKVGLWSHNTQVTVQCFGVMTVDLADVCTRP